MRDADCFEHVDIAAHPRRGGVGDIAIAVEAVRSSTPSSRWSATSTAQAPRSGFACGARPRALRRRAGAVAARGACEALASRRHRQGHRLHADPLACVCTLPRQRTHLSHQQRRRARKPLRGLALGRKSWLFAGSQRGAERAALMYTLIQTAKLNDVDPQAWLADVLARIADLPQTTLSELLPWNWRTTAPAQNAA